MPPVIVTHVSTNNWHLLSPLLELSQPAITPSELLVRDDHDMIPVWIRRATSKGKASRSIRYLNGPILLPLLHFPFDPRMPPFPVIPVPGEGAVSFGLD